MIPAIQWALFLARVALVVKVASSGTVYALAVAFLGVVALVTTARAWAIGKADQTWRGCFVGVSYLVVCTMHAGPMSGGLAWWFWGLFALQLSAKWTLGKRCTVTGPVFVDVVGAFPYNVVRHPMTAAEWGIAAVLAASGLDVHNAAAFGLVCVCNLLAIEAEESFLQAQDGYASYAATTRWRVLPGVW